MTMFPSFLGPPSFQVLMSGKLTWQWKIHRLKMYSLLNMGIVYCHVSLYMERFFSKSSFWGIHVKNPESAGFCSQIWLKFVGYWRSLKWCRVGGLLALETATQNRQKYVTPWTQEHFEPKNGGLAFGSDDFPFSIG